MDKTPPLPPPSLPPPPPLQVSARGDDGTPASAPDTRLSPSVLPYAVAAVSVAVLGAVAALLFAQPRRSRMALDEVIVLDGPATPSPARPANAAAPSVAEAPERVSAVSPASPAAPHPAAEPAPGDVLEALLTDEGSSGDGSAKIGGLTVYVAGGRRGERVRFRILEVKTSRKGNRYARAELVAAGGGTAPAGEGTP